MKCADCTSLEYGHPTRLLLRSLSMAKGLPPSSALSVLGKGDGSRTAGPRKCSGVEDRKRGEGGGLRAKKKRAKQKAQGNQWGAGAGHGVVLFLCPFQYFSGAQLFLFRPSQSTSAHPHPHPASQASHMPTLNAQRQYANAK